MQLRRQAKDSLLQELRNYSARKYLRCPGIKSLRIAMILATAGNPHRFRTKRQYWTYSGLAVETKSSDDYEIINGRIRRKRKFPLTRGLNRNYSRRLKRVYKGAAQNAKHHRLFAPYYAALLERGLRPSLANLTLARKIAAINLITWKKEERFDPAKVNLIPAKGAILSQKANQT
jgi:transposase